MKRRSPPRCRAASDMLRSKSLALCTFVWLTADRLLASDPGPTQGTSSDGLVYHAPIPVNSPFPDSTYGAYHRGSTLGLTYPFTSPFGRPDHSQGQFVYSCAAFFPRNSEGVFGMDVWLEQQDSHGNWSPVGQNGGLADNHGQAYQPINTPNPGPSPSYTFTWTFNGNNLPAHANFRVFVYVYIYNQGGGSQGDFPIYSTTNTVNTGAANDAPLISWSPSGGTTNPTQVAPGQTYVISADGQDDNGNLTFNYPELVGNSLASMTAMSYHVHERTAGDAAYQTGTYLLTDLTGQILKEFWPDIKRHLHGRRSTD